MSPQQKTYLTVGLVVLASLLAYWILSVWYPLIFVVLIGIGLTKAGITGKCPMTNLWAKFGGEEKEA